MKYQLTVMGPGKGNWLAELRDEFENRVRDIGLDPNLDTEFVEAADGSNINWNEGVPVAIWFGGDDASDQADIDLLAMFLDEQLPVFPVVDDLDRFQDLVPPDLHRINGQPWEKERVASDVLRAFRLTRLQRQAFVSYKRSETRGLAVQLYETLSHRGYRAFLDTASVESGEDFQETLWARMADVDLLIFLDSPDALSSRWVHQELARAHDLGLGVLQLVWPGHTRTTGTEFSDFIQLSATDFQNQSFSADGMLDDPKLAEVLAAAEQTRIRSLSVRRLRVVADLIDQAIDAGLEAIVHPVDPIELQRNGATVAKVIPLVGLPDAPAIQREEIELPADVLKTTRIVYDGLGMNPDWLDHIEWLNRREGLITTQLEFINGWLGEL